MKNTNKLWLIAAIIAGIALAFSGCEGPVGPQGDQGLQGEPGNEGNAGTTIVWQGEFAEAPQDPEEGWTYFNTESKRAYIFLNGTWQRVSHAGEDGNHGDPGADGEPGADGSGFYWLGSYNAAPQNPSINQAYFNTETGNAYIWKGPPRNWVVMLVGTQIGGGGAIHDLPELIIGPTSTHVLNYDCQAFTDAGLRVYSQTSSGELVPLPGYWYALYWNGHAITEEIAPQITAAGGAQTIRIVDLMGRWVEFDVTASGHIYIDWIDPTCTIAGNTSRVCTIDYCGSEDTRTTGYTPIGHNWIDNWTKKSDPTCIASGVDHRFCTRLHGGSDCHETGYEQERTGAAAYGHSWDIWTISTINDINATAIANLVCSRNSSHECSIPNQNINATSFADLMSKLPENTAATAYNLVVNISDLGTVADNGSFANIISNNPTKFVSLDMSNSTFTSIEMSAFNGCTSLISINIPNSVIWIGGWAFTGCTSLASVTIGNGVTSIGDMAFRDCTSLTSIVIPNSVTSIGYAAFLDCTSLSSINIPDSVTSIGTTTFSGCTSLSSINIPDSVTSIGSNTFSGCTSLASVTIGNSVTSIGNSAFNGCTSLTSIVIPSSVTSIGAQAFYGCTSLSSVRFDGIIVADDFSEGELFPGDLRAKYLEGGIGTYTRVLPSFTWTKQN